MTRDAANAERSTGVPSPCVRVCRLDAAGRVCTGCGRTLEEIAGWSAMSEDGRRGVLARLAGRA